MLNLPSAVSFGAKNSAEETTGSRNLKHARAEGARPHICMAIVSCCPNASAVFALDDQQRRYSSIIRTVSKATGITSQETNPQEKHGS